MDANLRRRARERQIAEEIASELRRAFGGPIMPEALGGGNRDIVCEVFGRVFDSHQILSESAAARILAHVPRYLAAQNQGFADLNLKLDAAIRHRQPARSLTERGDTRCQLMGSSA
jgi:hypothetical protein